ncbi:DYH14 protein, partial [Galbula dea]|nr:DYH14 protein [Galbula dea]
DEDYPPQMDQQNKMLKEKLVSRLWFEPERTEVLLLVRGRYIECGPADSSDKEDSELPSPVEKKYAVLRTAVYRASTERKQRATAEEQDMCFGNVLSNTHKEGREESVCQLTNMSEHGTMKLIRNITKMACLRNENLKKTLPIISACKEVKHGFGTPPSSPVHDNTRKSEMQTAFLEPSCHKKTCEQLKVESSFKKSWRTKVHSYDRSEPTDDDVIMQILRLRGKLGWQTKLPSCEWLARVLDVTRPQKFTLKKPLLLEDSGEYIYCLQRNRNNSKAPYNPYDLQAVSTNTALQNKAYWTVSASFVSKFSEGNRLGEMETTAVPRWLRDRQRFWKILSLNFFSKFRLKKCFLVWKENVQRRKMHKTKPV